MLSACVGVGPDSPPGPRGQYSGHMGHAAYQAAHLCCRRGCTGTEEHRPAYKLVYELGQGSWGPATVSAPLLRQGTPIVTRPAWIGFPPAPAHLLGSGATGAGPRGLSCSSGSNLRYKDCFLRADSLNCREGSRVTGAPDTTASTPRPTSRPGAALTRVACRAERRKQPGRPPRPVRGGYRSRLRNRGPGLF